MVTLQFVAPLILCLYLTLMYKSLGGYSWTGIFTESVLQHECSAELEPPVSSLQDFAEGSGMLLLEEAAESDFNILESAHNLQTSIMNLKNVIIPHIALEFCYLKFYIVFRSSQPKCTKAFWVLPHGGVISSYLPLHHWVLFISHISTKPKIHITCKLIT